MKNDKKVLYEAIMKSVARTVKKALNEYIETPNDERNTKMSVGDFFRWSAGELTEDAFNGLNALEWCGFDVDNEYFGSNEELLDFVCDNVDEIINIHSTRPMRNFYLHTFSIDGIDFKCYTPYDLGDDVE